MIVDPWGQVLNRLPHGTGVVVANIDMVKLEHSRKMFPRARASKISMCFFCEV